MYHWSIRENLTIQLGNKNMTSYFYLVFGQTQTNGVLANFQMFLFVHLNITTKDNEVLERKKNPLNSGVFQK